MTITFSRYTPTDATEAVYNVLVGGCASSFRPRPDRAAAIAYLAGLREQFPKAELVVWDGDAARILDTVDDLP